MSEQGLLLRLMNDLFSESLVCKLSWEGGIHDIHGLLPCIIYSIVIITTTIITIMIITTIIAIITIISVMPLLRGFAVC